MLDRMSFLMSTALAGTIRWLAWWEVHLPMVNNVGLVFAEKTAARVGTMKEGSAEICRRSVEDDVSTFVFKSRGKGWNGRMQQERAKIALGSPKYMIAGSERTKILTSW